jgi:glycosyltransferase involved in cell wall biosynthesis
MPTYNRDILIKESIESIINQTYSDFELLIISDGSTDNTEAVVKAFNDERIKYFSIENSGRPAVPRNYGIKQSQGKYIAFCDDDDLWTPSKLQKQVFFMEAHPDTFLTYGFAESFGDPLDSGSLLHTKKESMMAESFEILLLGNKIPLFTVMLRKECLTETGVFDDNPDLKALEDYDLWLRIAMKYKISCIPEMLGRYRKHPNNVSINRVELRKKHLPILEKFAQNGWADKSLLRKARSILYWSIGNALLSEKNGEYRLWFSRSFLLHINAQALFALILYLLPLEAAYKLFYFVKGLKIKHLH